MSRFAKAIAGGLGAAVANVLVPFIVHYLPAAVAASPDFESSLRYLLFAVITAGTVYVAPANAA